MVLMSCGRKELFVGLILVLSLGVAACSSEDDQNGSSPEPDAGGEADADVSEGDAAQMDTGPDAEPDTGPEPEPEPDTGPEPEPDPPVDTLVRFVGVGLGTRVCDGETEIVSILSEGGQASHGYELWAPGSHTLQDNIEALECGALGSSDFTLSLQEGDVKTVVLGVSTFGPSTVTDNPDAPEADESRIRVWGEDRVGTGDLTDVEYCVDGEPLSGGSSPSTGYLDVAAGSFDVDVHIADGACDGEVRDTFSIMLDEGEVRSVFLAPGSRPGPVRDESDVYIIDCLDSIDGEPTTPSNCSSSYADMVE